jgi:hypothetical protein
MERSATCPLTRRAFLAWTLGATASSVLAAARPSETRGGGRPSLRIGLFADAHSADRPPAGGRNYRAALVRVREAAEAFRDERLDLAVELGDLIDGAGGIEEEIEGLSRIEAEFARFPGERHHVLGNHCVWTLSKEEFLGRCGARAARYSVDRGGWHLIFLDACFRADGVPYGRKNFQWPDAELPPAERAWLEEDLRKAEGRALVFLHQRLDVVDDYAVRSAPAIRRILEASGKVAAVFQGHYHAGDHRVIGGIHYVTLAALVEGKETARAVLEAFPDGSLRLAGTGRQRSLELGKAPSPHRSRL